MSEPLTHSDLIYLFVDGEASPAERSKLYDALANNPELQAEFEDAMRMKEAVEREVQTAIPPPSLTESLFLRAGVAVPVAATSAVAPAIPAITNLANSGWFALVKSFALPALAVSGAMTYGVIKLTENNTPLPPAAPQAVSRTIEDHRSLPQMITTISPETPVMAEAELVEKPSPFNTARKSSVSVIKENNPAVKMASEPPVTQQPTTNTAVNNTSVSNGQLNTPVVQKSNTEDVAIASVPSASINELSPSAISNVGGVVDNINLNPLEVSEHYTGSFTLGYERYAGSSYFQDRNGKVPSTGFALNNSAIIGMLRIDAHHSVGLMIGEESFPFYLKNADGGFSAQPSLNWFGVGYRYTFVEVETSVGSISPSVRGIIGGSQAGALGKAKVGLDWNLFESPITISGGYELTELIYQTSSATLGAGKTAVTFGINYTF